MAQYPILRITKGSPLTYIEMDGNLSWLASNLNGPNVYITGSSVNITGSTNIIGDLTVKGTGSFDVLIMNYISSSVLYASGSTKFGDTSDDTHQFTGSLFISGATVSLTGGSFSGSGANLFGIPASGIVGLNLSRIATGSISASVDTNVSASFRIVNGSNTLLNVNSIGRTWIGNGTSADAGFQLDVNGTTRINGTLNVTSSLILENNTILFDVVTGPPTGPLRIVRRTGWGVNAGIEIGALNTNISTFTAVPTIIGGGNTYSDNRQAIIGQNNAISGIGVVLGNDNTVTNSSNTNVIIGTGNVQNVSNFNNFAHILVGQGNSTNGFAGGGLFGSAIKYYAAGQLAFGANSSFTNNTISDVYFGNGVRNENNTGASNNGNGPNISINTSWASDAADKNGGNITLNGGRGTGTGSSGDVYSQQLHLQQLVLLFNL